MATDNTHVLGGEGVSGDTSQEFNPEVVQVAAADGATGTAQAGNGQQAANQTPPIPGVPNGEVQVQVPAGETVVRVQVAPGETIDLPFDGALAAKFGEQGNLAIKLGDTTIILLGYAEANQQAGVTVKDDKGQAIDVATVVAQTDPNLDIQTAAGPAGGPTGGQGGHLFFGFNGAGGLGGFGELGVINPTELQYQLIQPDEKILITGTSPDIMSITIDFDGVVNEDDLGRTPILHESQTESFGKSLDGSEINNPELADQIAGLFSNVHYGNFQNGNDPYDTTDHEGGSQTDGSNAPDGDGQGVFTDNNDGIDQDRDPLTVKAHVTVNFFQDLPGHLQFANGGTAPVITYLEGKNITSHGNALSYMLLPADGTHGQTVIAYYTTGDGESSCTNIVFSLEILQAQGNTSISTFDIAFTIYGVIDNTGQGSGVAGEDLFDIPTAFFAVDSDGSVTASPAGNLVFASVDDVPQLGHYTYSTVWCPATGSDGGHWENIPTGFHPANLTIGLDESHGVQHTPYSADANNDHGGSGHDIGDIDPTGALGQHSDQTTDDVGGSHAWNIQSATKGEINDILNLTPITDSSDPDFGSDANQLLIYQQGILSKLDSSFISGGNFCAPVLGVACSSLDVSFGADGKAMGDKQAGQTLFDQDGSANATAFQLYMQEGTGNPVGNTQDSILTNLWISVVDADGCVVKEQVTAYQLDANTIIGIAPGVDKGEQVPASINREGEGDPLASDGNNIPVFVLHLDPTTGELTLIQYHQVNNPEGCDPNDPIEIKDAEGNSIINFRATDFDGDYVDAPLSVAFIDDAPKICATTYCNGNEVDEDFLNAGSNGIRGNHDKDTNPNSNDDSSSVTNGDGPGHTHIDGQINATGVDVPLTYGFNVAGLHAAGDSVACFKDDSNNTVKSADGHDVGLTLTKDGCNWVITGSYTDDSDSPHTVFTLTLDSETGKFDFCLLGALEHPLTSDPNVEGGTTRYEDNLLLDFGIKVTDVDGDKAYSNGTSQGIQINIDDDAPRLVCPPQITCTETGCCDGEENQQPSVASIDEGEGERETCLQESTCKVTIDVNNQHPDWVHITATDDQGVAGATVDTATGAGFGVSSDTDGTGQDRFHEINYDDNGGEGGIPGSEQLIFSFDKLIESGTVELARFFSDENHVGNEKGHWDAYRDGVLIASGDFTANSTTGQFGLAIPTVAGGFDKLVFTGLPGTASGGGEDESDYLVQRLDLNLLPCNTQKGEFSYAFGADNGHLPAVDLTCEPGSLGVQVHYTGDPLCSGGQPVTISESYIGTGDGDPLGAYILIQGFKNGDTNEPVFELKVYPGTPDSHGVSHASYVYTEYAPLDNDALVKDSDGMSHLPFDVKITDNDGDAIHTTINVCVDDSAPVVGEACATVFEKGLADGTAHGDGSNSTTGFLNFSYNGDGPGHISAFSFNGFGGDPAIPAAAATDDGNGHWVIDNSVFTMSVDQVTGYYTFSLKDNFENTDTSTDSFTNLLGHTGNNYGTDLLECLGFQFSATDSDGTVTSGGSLEVKVTDDGPIAHVDLTNCTVSIDETPFVQGDSNDKPYFQMPSELQGLQGLGGHLAMGWAQSNGAIVTTGASVYGADGPGQVTTSLSVSQPGGVDSGLFALNGQHIYLFEENGLVVGRIGSGDAADASGTVAFALELGADGKLSIVQYEPISHPNATDPDDSVQIADGVVYANVDVVDSDGDHATNSVDIGKVVSFQDDGPSANNDYATLDETLPSGIDPDHDPHKVTGNVVLGFSNDLNLFNNSLPDYQSVDHPHSISQMVYGDTTIQLDFTKTDDAALTLGGGVNASNVHFNSATGVLSFDTPYGHLDIVVHAAIADPNPLSIADYTNSNELGFYTYTGAHNAVDTYYGAALDGLGNSALPPAGNEVNWLLQQFGDVTITNNFGGTDGDPTNWGFKVVNVDGKSYAGLGVPFGLDVGETDTNPGGKAPEQVTLGLPSAANNATVTLGALFDGVNRDNGHMEVVQWQAIGTDGHTVVASGQVFGNLDGLVDIHIQTGNTLFSSIVLTPLDDGAGNNGNNSDFLVVGVNTCAQVNVNEQFTYTLTDADGDSSSANLNINVVDDKPSIASRGNTTDVKIDEDGLPNGAKNDVSAPNSDTAPGDIIGGHSSASEASWKGGVFNYSAGADGFETLTLNATGSLQTLDGKAVLFAWDASTMQLIGYEAGDTSKHVIEVNLTPGNGVDYSQGFKYDVNLLEPLKDPQNNNEDSVKFDIQVQVEDQDCDVVQGTIHVTVNDDRPIVEAALERAPVSLTVDETTANTSTGNLNDGDETSASGVLTTQGWGTVLGFNQASAAGLFQPVVFGADGPAANNSLVYSLTKSDGSAITNGTSTGLTDTYSGHAISLYNEGNGIITGRIDGSTGAVVFALTIDNTGEVTMAQYRAIVNSDPADPDQSVSPATISGLVYVSETATDGDGDAVSATSKVGLTLNFEDDGPIANKDSATSTGVNVPVTGNVLDNDAVGNDHVAGFDHGKVLTYTVGQTTYQADGTTNTIPGIGTISMDSHGNYTFDQTTGSGGIVKISYTMEDGDHDQASSDLCITLKQTAKPVNYDDVANTDDATDNSNIMIIFDRSGSMGDDPSVSGFQHRIDLARAALDDMLAKYGDHGDVRVMIVDFSDGANSMPAWGTIAQAEAYLNTLSAGGNTSYSDALTEAESAWNKSGKGGADYSNYVYFLSDGVPTADGDGTSGHHLTNGPGSQKDVWDTFLESHNINGVFSVGVGGGISASDPDLTDVANPDGNNIPDSHVILATDEGTLGNQLGLTVPGHVQGNVLDGSLSTPVGQADTPGDAPAHVSTFSYPGGGLTFTWDGDITHACQETGGLTSGVTIIGQDVTFTTLYGTMSFHFVDGSFDFTPNVLSTSEQEVFHYVTTDSDGDLGNGANLTINIAHVNHAPIAADDTATTNEDAPILINVLGNDSDPDGDPLGITLGAASHGVISIVAGQVLFTPDADFYGTGGFSYTVTDSHGATSTANVVVTVNPVNDAPVNTVPGTQSVAENSNKASISGISISDIDAGSSQMKVTLTCGHGSFNLSGGGGSVSGNNSGTVTITGSQAQINAQLATLKYTPDSNYHGTDTLQIVTNDNGNTGSGGAKTATSNVSINVTGNLAPAAKDDLVLTNINTGFLIEGAWLTFNDSDPENDAVSVAAVSGAVNLTSGPTLDVNHNVTVDINNTGTDASFNYKISDGVAQSSNAAVTVHYDSTAGDSKINGGNGDDIIVHSGSGHTLNGNNGNDIIVDYGHNNTINGGSGHDRIVVSDLTDTIDGGNASENLGGTNLGDILDVSHISGAVDIHGNAGHINHIETIDSTGGGIQTVTLQASDVINISDGTYNPSDGGVLPTVEAMRVEGDAGDTLKLDDASGQWHKVTTDTNVPDGHTLYAFDSNGGGFDAGHVTAYVIVNNSVTVQDHDGNTITS